jgi:hypothetical protein
LPIFRVRRTILRPSRMPDLRPKNSLRNFGSMPYWIKEDNFSPMPTIANAAPCGVRCRTLRVASLKISDRQPRRGGATCDR